MAGKMHDFVHSKEGRAVDSRQGPAHGGNVYLDDLKQPIAEAPITLNTPHMWSGNQSTKQPAAVMVQQRHADAQPPNRRRSADREKFYDTDASDIDRTSTTGSVNHGNTAIARSQSPRAAMNGHVEGHQRSGSSSGNDDDDDDERTTEYGYEGNVRDDRIHGNLDRRLVKLMNKTDAERNKQHSGLSQLHMDGDSYPTTTSGNPSHADTESIRDKRAQATAPTPLPNRGGPHRQPLPASAAAPTHGQGRPRPGDSVLSQKLPGSNIFVSQSHSAEPNYDGKDIYQTGQAGKQKTAVQPPPHKDQHVAYNVPASRPAVSHILAHRGSAPTMNSSSNQGPNQQLKTGPTRAHGASPEQAQVSQHRRNSRNPTPFQQQRVVAASQHEQLSDTDTESRDQVPSGANPAEQQYAHEPPIDYDATALSKMEYQDLKQQSFDVDPNAESFEFPAGQQNDSLEQKLGTVAALQAKDQDHFFKSLTLDEWEQAGDWFLSRFSDVVGKLKSARQEKRKAARVFEDEVESRHSAIGTKRKHIEQSLTEMRECGGKVLQGTPKKMRTK